MSLCYKPFQNLFPFFESANGIVPILNGIWIKKSPTLGLDVEPQGYWSWLCRRALDPCMRVRLPTSQGPSIGNEVLRGSPETHWCYSEAHSLVNQKTLGLAAGQLPLSRDSSDNSQYSWIIAVPSRALLGSFCVSSFWIHIRTLR